MEAARSLETLLHMYQTARSHILENKIAVTVLFYYVWYVIAYLLTPYT